MATDLNIDSDFEFDFALTRRNATTRAWEPATGLNGVTGRFAATPTGAALGSTSTALTEAGSLGRYVGTLDSATMVTALAAYVGQVVYAVCAKSGDVEGEYQTYLVRRGRQMAAG